MIKNIKQHSPQQQVIENLYNTIEKYTITLQKTPIKYETYIHTLSETISHLSMAVKNLKKSFKYDKE